MANQSEDQIDRAYQAAWEQAIHERNLERVRKTARRIGPPALRRHIEACKIQVAVNQEYLAIYEAELKRKEQGDAQIGRAHV